MIAKTKCRHLFFPVLTLCMILLSATAVAAASSNLSVAPRYISMGSFAATLSINDSGNATASGSVSVFKGYTAEAFMELQQKNSGNWTTICDWSAENISGTFSKNRYVVSGYEYRVKLSVDVYDKSGALIESETTYSPIVDY